MKRFALALLLTASTTSLVAAPAAAAAPAAEELGLELVPYSKKLGDRRYQSQRDYEGTIKFFRDKFKGWKTIKWTREVSLPAVKYIHLENSNDKAAWEGVNIYQLKTGEVRFYVLKREAPAAAAAAVTAPTAKTTTTTTTP
ncbi:MAG: hypothetical protein Q8O67_05930 [Deltaproteobacteria bacterium]|nr:hypothetical protein [Deltaproteobacteria bacterium]